MALRKARLSGSSRGRKAQKCKGVWGRPVPAVGEYLFLSAVLQPDHGHQAELREEMAPVKKRPTGIINPQMKVVLII